MKWLTIAMAAMVVAGCSGVPVTVKGPTGADGPTGAGGPTEAGLDMEAIARLCAVALTEPTGGLVACDRGGVLRVTSSAGVASK